MYMKILFRLLFLSLFILSSSAAAQTAAATAPVADKVVVYKSQRKMQLLKNGQVIRTYKIALGDNPKGHKQQEGDEKTPEGKYKLDWRNPNSAYHKSIHISYPNQQDKARAKKQGVSPGGDIMIHGLPKHAAGIGARHALSDWTNGCIAITNEEMDEVWTLVRNGTEIEILP